MKLQDIKEATFLAEMAEKLDRNMYGAWIDANTYEIYDVLKEGDHVKFIESKMDEWGIPHDIVKKLDDYYVVGFAKGLVRAVFRPAGTVTVDGLAKDLKRITRIITATAVQQDVKFINVNKVTKLGDRGTSMKSFEMPKDREALHYYLKS